MHWVLIPFSVVSRNGTAWLGMSYCTHLKLLTGNCQTTDNQQIKWQINEETKQDKFKTKMIIKITSLLTTKLIRKQTTLVQVQIWKNRAASAKTTMKMQNEFSVLFTGIVCFKGTFLLKVKEDAKPDNGTTRDRRNSWMVQQLCHSVKTQWNSMVVHGPSKAQSGTNMAYTQGANIKWFTTQTNRHTLYYQNWCHFRTPSPRNLIKIHTFNQMYMSIAQVKVHQTTLCSSTSRWHAGEQD